MGSSPLRLVVVGRHGPERFGRGEAQSAAARHEVAFVPTRMVAEICDAVTPSTEQTAAISAKETGYGMEEEVEFLERDMAQRAVELTQGNINKAAELLGVPPRTLARRLRALNNQSGKSGDSMAEEEG
jgi:DNA-binding NtrC family response regulator